ncbi:MAG: roadblock/LC7 domain-containing protein [Candidatus Helarchaeota archaeon]
MTEKLLNDKIMEILKELESNISEIQSSFVCSITGIPIESASPVEDMTKLSAETSAILSVSRQVANDSEVGEVNDIIIKGDKSTIIIKNITRELVLSVKADASARLGLLLMDINEAAKEIKKIYSSN